MNKGVKICGHLFGKSVRYMCFEKKKKKYLKIGNKIFLLIQTTCSLFFIQLRLNRCEFHRCRKRIVNETVKEKKVF